MILVGNQRGGASDLARHLMKEENDHVTIHELRGFVARELHGALAEAHAVSRGTKCKQYLFSLSLNPPANARARTEDYEAAIDRIEGVLGLTGQPRAIVFHEKQGRRHAHCVWSRIRPEEMKAVQLAFTHRKLMDVARELYMEHGWQMPRGLARSEASDPANFTLAEWQQAKRRQKDPRTIKTALQDAWAISDSKGSLVLALKERGYRLARGDSKAFVVLDRHGEVYSLPRWIEVKTREVRARLGAGDNLPDVASAKAEIAKEMAPVLARLKGEALSELGDRNKALRAERNVMLARHRDVRRTASERMEARRWEEARQRQARFRTGLKGVWDWMRGETQRIREQNEADARAAMQRDKAEMDALIFAQLEERRRLIDLRSELAKAFALRSRDLRDDVRAYEVLRGEVGHPSDHRRQGRLGRYRD
ncbi:relaxase/mobilization nuclease domain-containing protein [Xanthobacter autotrophicus]|uniref:relaxase/mobilization nuclease domain-containing protein n=1 Tax=Xanthobacter autotrophicus TaxID=280 RepID=UPI00372C9B1F